MNQRPRLEFGFLINLQVDGESDREIKLLTFL